MALAALGALMPDAPSAAGARRCRRRQDIAAQGSSTILRTVVRSAEAHFATLEALLDAEMPDARAIADERYTIRRLLSVATHNL